MKRRDFINRIIVAIPLLAVPQWVNGMPKKYNAKARKLMKKHTILINDLYAFVVPRITALQKPRNVHFSKKGSETLGKEVANIIKKQLELK